MNYLRGAVSAISAPYQYYKDLNPSTLTGAIDVIVVRRPKNIGELPAEAPPRQLTDDETELVCSPFHVRFGKWQVLRPQDKKVDIFVNGELVPFSMKIGEAGEAFFVFETEEDVPDSLVTSPILEATQPGQTNAQNRETGRFGASASSFRGGETPESSQEPEFLDLDATPESPSRDGASSSAPQPNDPSEDGSSGSQSILSRTAQLGKAMLGAAHEVERSERDKLKDKTVLEALRETREDQRQFITDKAAATLNVTKNAHIGFPSVEDKGDKVLPENEMDQVHEPDVRYARDMVFDVDGYHSQSHGRDASDATLRSNRPRRSSPSDPSSADRTPGPSRTPSPSPSTSTPPSSSGVPFPVFRATSEPPPDHDEFSSPSTSRLINSEAVTRTPSGSIATRPHLSTLPPTASPDPTEYTWDWGNFPQKTPVRTTFPHVVGHSHGHNHLAGVSVDLTPRKGKGRMMSEELGVGELTRNRAISAMGAIEEDDGTSFGLGGRLTVDRKDPTRFRVFIEGRVIEFELAIVPPVQGKELSSGPLGGVDEVEDEKRFEQNKVDFNRFLDEAQTVSDDNLVLRWAGDKYIRRQDGSPLMDALVTWRESALRDKSSHLSSRPTSPSPVSEDEAIRSEGDEPALEDRRPTRSVTAIGNETAVDGTNRAPTSSSWVRWWSRSRRADTTRPDMGHMSSDPSAALKTAKSFEEVTPVKRALTSESAPPAPSTPETTSSNTPTQGTPDSEKRFAKTLRLTSDQLKSLNLKSGANSVTFSLSATGVAACTARLFVWDYADSVVVSDIDGTITKSDALGHVFTMIGRDWTHLGVAKLYTDICRNGYKILYLTSRAIGQADSTREYLKGIKQNDYQLPEGPVIMSPDRLMASLHREVIMRKPEVFKMACLRDVQKLFGGPTHNPFYAGFGNRITDALSYRSVSIPSSRIFTIDSTGEVKMELLELAGYKSSYIHMTDLVDQMFPPINRKWASEYTDFNYWKAPIQDFPLPDLSPPSPALSARSDTSNQSTFARLRNFSLVSSRPPTNRFSLPPPATEASQATGNGSGKRSDEEQANETRLRQMTSFERLSSTLANLTTSSSSTAGSPRSSSPTLHDSDSEYEEEDGDVEGQKIRRNRQRRRSVASMPGSLPGSEPGSDDEMVFGEDEDEDHGYEGENEEDVPDEALDEALFAAGEMNNVDYI
ncbi:Lipin/Ned1/Smp2-domain-containing protein [Trametes meyenii]|nr:Lipin/Ned1/Smp2-domain-containing protein [Trametes meyenii]